MNTSLLETPRLILRPWQEADAASLYKYASDPAIGPVAGWPPHTSVEHSLEVIRTVFAAPETYAVVLKATGEPVGSAGIMRAEGMHSAAMQPDEAEIGYWIGVPYWGQGLIPEAVQCLLQRCFVDLGVSAVWCGYYEGNERSRRVMEKCGLTHHHTETGDASPLGDVRTEHFMRITAEEWRVSRAFRIIGKAGRTDMLITRLMRLWEASVRATHHFLSESDIRRIMPAGEEVLRTVDILVVAYAGDMPIGFMCVQEQKIEALFIATDHIGRGIGKRLILSAINLYKAEYIDVNEQNARAADIYRHLGFEVFRRDEVDGQGNPFPILHMKLNHSKARV